MDSSIVSNSDIAADTNNNSGSEASKHSWTFWWDLLYGFIVVLIFILTIGVPSVAIFLGVKFLPAMILWALSCCLRLGFAWLDIAVALLVPALCILAATLIIMASIWIACELFYYARKLSDEKNIVAGKEPIDRSRFRRILAGFGCFSFGLSSVIFPVCAIVFVLDAIYIAVALIVLTFLILILAAQGGGCNGFNQCGGCNNKIDAIDSRGGCCCCCISDGLFALAPKAFYCCLKIVTTGQNFARKEYDKLRNQCSEAIKNLSKSESNEKDVVIGSLDMLLENAKYVDKQDIKKLRSEIAETIIKEKIIPLVVILAIKQKKSVEQVFDLREISVNRRRAVLNFKSFEIGINKLLNGACNKINGKQINKISNKQKVISFNDEYATKLFEAYCCCPRSIKKYLGDIKNQRSLYENLIQEKTKQKGNKNEITVE